MKYIRTKDGRIRIVIDTNEFDEEERRKIPDNCTMVKANNIYGCVIVENKNIIKQDDTIEELCDEFVLVAEDYDYFQTTRKIHRRWVFDDLAYTEEKEYEIGKGISRTIYGAIWTEKGLIYVAKVNDKGELELCEKD